MKALRYKGKNEVAVEEVEDPKIEKPTDAIIRITSAAICGSDLHMYEGRTGVEKDTVLGHEIMGTVLEVGEAVQSIKKGDRVVLPFNVSCGLCFNCVRGWTSACLTLNPEKAGAAYGFAGMGPFDGGQAELVQVPYADFNCLKLPGKPGDEFEDDFLMLADIFPTGYHAAELAHVEPGSTVAIFGAGPVGLLSALSSYLRGASEIYVVDAIQDRLDKVKEIPGAVAIDMSKGNPVEQIKAIRKANKLIVESLRPGEEKMNGVMCGIDAVGYQARSDANYDTEHPTQILDHLAELVNPTGHIGIIGVFVDQDPGAQDDQAKKGVFPFPLGKFWDKGITIGMGQCPVKKYNVYLRDLIIAGKAKPGFIVSHRVPIDDAPKRYDLFDKRTDGHTKVVIKNKV